MVGGPLLGLLLTGLSNGTYRPVGAKGDAKGDLFLANSTA